jgi:hypothetical protein
MRLKVRSLWRAVKDDLRIECVPPQLTSYGGLELYGRYFRKLEVVACSATPGPRKPSRQRTMALSPGARRPLGPAAVTIGRHLARIFVTV